MKWVTSNHDKGINKPVGPGLPLVPVAPFAPGSPGGEEEGKKKKTREFLK